MKERGILFSALMVRALLAGAKTQTRRIIKPQPPAHLGETPGAAWNSGFVDVACPYGTEGDRLWVRETWCAQWTDSDGFSEDETFYGADGKHVNRVDGDGCIVYRKDGFEASPWKPGIHMPRSRSRITLAVTGVRAQRLQEISEEDARAEGCGIDWERVFENDGSLEGANYGCVTCSGDPRGLACLCHPIGQGKPWRCRYANLWDDIHGAGAWAANPWVWALTFKVLEKYGQGVPAAAGGAAAGAAAPDATGTG